MENLLKLKQTITMLKNASVQLMNFKMVIVFLVCSTVLPTGPDTVRSATA